MGYITKGNGISIHRETCPNIRNIEERLIDVEWNEKTEKKYKLDLLITTTQNQMNKINSNKMNLKNRFIKKYY